MTDVQQQAVKPRRVIHAQVGGSPSQEQLHQVAQMVLRASMDPEGGTLTTDPSITIREFTVDADTPIDDIVVSGSFNPELLAEVSYEAVQSFNEAVGEVRGNSWAFASVEDQSQFRHAVASKLRYPSSPQQTHASWLRSQVDQGWKFGKVFSEEAKTNPNLLPYEALPDTVRIKDALLHSVISTLRNRLPKPTTDQIRKIEVFNAAADDWMSGDFLKLQPGYIFRFIGDVQPHVAISEPFIAYDNNQAFYSVDARPVDQAPPAKTVADGGYEDVGPEETPGDVDDGEFHGEAAPAPVLKAKKTKKPKTKN